MNRHLFVDLLNLIGEPFHLELQTADLLIELLGRGRGVVVLAGRGQALAMGHLQFAELWRFWLVRVGRELVAGEEDVDRPAQLDSDVVFELRVTAAGSVVGPVRWLGPIAVAGDVDHCIT